MAIHSDSLVVLGAGWLGKALCLQAQQQGWQVQGTHRSNQHQLDFQRQLRLDNGQLSHQLDLTDAWWVCCITPGSRHKQSDYAATLAASLQLAKQLHCKGFLLCSSTGVYNQASAVYDENSVIDDRSPRQQKLYAAEQQVLNAGGKVLRLAGLLGPNREPGRFVAGKQLTSSSQQVVNMVHQADVISAIFTVLSNWQRADPIYNIVNPAHPTKAVYYQQKCQLQGTTMPEFTSDEKAERIIDGSAIESLGFRYQYTI
ncbi:NAD-dependent epimerase/dehydratase family protein [Pseudoalteromonas mariniglutinosa]|uniref:NAD-dependent epimerase/dehydratase family protein n=1 Tax=Pseudoalteromonas mariniglutinosa TaxID=206042 RepID=UPI00385075AF